MSQKIFAGFARTLLIGCCVAVVSCREIPQGRTSEAQSSAEMERAKSTEPGLVKSEFIFETAPFPECHASTIVETESGLVAAWFGGTHERNPDVGIWLSRLLDGKWTAPVEVANGVQSATNRYPCWNPVLFQPKNGPLVLFYKVGPSPGAWWGMLMRLPDLRPGFEKHLPKPQRLPEGILGPIKNKPVQLTSGDILCPSSTEDHGWRVHFEWTSDLGRTWHKTEPVNDGKAIGAIQPSILFHPGNRLRRWDGQGKERFLRAGRTTMAGRGTR